MRKAFFLTTCLMLLIFCNAYAQTGPTVAVTGGTIQGRALGAPGGAVFKGIPFAAPPVGDLRWREPQAVKSWAGTLQTVEFSAPCTQIASGWNDKVAAAAKEDCLYLNVWTSEWPANGKKPVMFWIHGGANMGGSAMGFAGIELYMFGNLLPDAADPMDRKLSDQMQVYWTNFAKSGNPNGGGLPEWPRLSKSSRSYVELAADGPVVKNDLRAPFCSLFSEKLEQDLSKATGQT